MTSEMRRQMRAIKRKSKKFNKQGAKPGDIMLERAASVKGERVAHSHEEAQKIEKELREHEIEDRLTKKVDLTKRRKRLMKGKIISKETGYKSECILHNHIERGAWLHKFVNWVYRMLSGCSKEYEVWPVGWCRRIELKSQFVENKVVTRCMAITFDPKRKRMFLHAVPGYMLNRQTVVHLEKKDVGWAHKYGWSGEMVIPEPQEVNWRMGLDPTLEKVRYRLVEEESRDEMMDEGKEKIMAYRFERI